MGAVAHTTTQPGRSSRLATARSTVTLTGVQPTYQRLLADPAELDARLAKGEQHACRRADRTLARTMDARGL
jgi:hypothetical protein